MKMWITSSSPVWFNVGLYHQYGTGKNSGEGTWYYDRKAGKSLRAPTQYQYQNENLSVRTSDEFMQAALEGRDWWTRHVSDGEPCEKKNARELLRRAASSSTPNSASRLTNSSLTGRKTTGKHYARQALCYFSPAPPELFSGSVIFCGLVGGTSNPVSLRIFNRRWTQMDADEEHR